MNPEAVGRTLPDVAFTVDPDRVAAFRELLGQRVGGVPPTFLTVAEFLIFPKVIEDPVLQLDYDRVVHGNQEYGFAREIREGETLTVQTVLESVRVRGGTGFVTTRMEFVGEDGRVAATARSTMIERSRDA